MNFPTRSDSDSKATETTETETETVYDGRMEAQETYWAVIDTERYLQKLCVTYGVAVDDSGNKPYARYTDAEDQSPIADDGLFYYRTKKELGAELSEKREDGELNDDQNLPAYKDQFGELEADHAKITAENAEDYGLDADLFEDDEEIQLPAEYEPQTDEDDTLIVWYETNDGDKDFTMAEVLEIADETSGIGKKSLGNLEAALEAAME